MWKMSNILPKKHCLFLNLIVSWDDWGFSFPKDSVQFSRSVVSNSLQHCGLQHARLPCPSPFPRVCSNSCPLSQWSHLTISSSVVPFSSCPQSFPTTGSFPTGQLFTSGSQNIGASASASVFPMTTEGWFPLRLTGLISFDQILGTSWPSQIDM